MAYLNDEYIYADVTFDNFGGVWQMRSEQGNIRRLYNKPPAGIYPEKLWLEDRIQSLENAIERYKVAEKNSDRFQHELWRREYELEQLLKPETYSERLKKLHTWCTKCGIRLRQGVCAACVEKARAGNDDLIV